MSDGNSTDDGQKKRGREKEEEVFVQSKKTPRTPSKSSVKSDEKLDQILAGMANLTVQGQQLTTELHLAREEQRGMVEEIKAIREENTVLKELRERDMEENIKLREEMKEVKVRLEKLEKQKRENNIVIYGLSTDNAEVVLLKESTEKFLKEKLEVDVKVKAAHKLGLNVCLAEMESRDHKRSKIRNVSSMLLVGNSADSRLR